MISTRFRSPSSHTLARFELKTNMSFQASITYLPRSRGWTLPARAHVSLLPTQYPGRFPRPGPTSTGGPQSLTTLITSPDTPGRPLLSDHVSRRDDLARSGVGASLRFDQLRIASAQSRLDINGMTRDQDRGPNNHTLGKREFYPVLIFIRVLTAPQSCCRDTVPIGPRLTGVDIDRHKNLMK